MGFFGNDDKKGRSCGCTDYECCPKCCDHWSTKDIRNDDTPGCRDCSGRMSNRTSD